MPDFDYAPVSSPDEEEQKRRELAELYPPVGPPLTAGVAASAPPVGSTADLESRAGRTHEYAPVEAPQPVAPAPKWKDYAPAEPHGWSKVGHTLAGLWGPTDRVFNQRPMDQAVDRYKAAAQEHEAPIEERAKTATAEQKESQAALEREQARVAGNPKQGLTPEETTIHDLMTGENGGPRLNPQTGKPYTYLEAFGSVKQAGQDVKPDKERKTDKTVRIVNGVPHEVMVDAATGEDVKDLGQTKLPGESPEQKRSATESAQVEREARQNIRKAEGVYHDTEKSVGQLKGAIDGASDGNGLLTSFVPTMEVLGINAANGVHRISPAEAQAAGMPGSFVERFNAFFDKAATGKLTPELKTEGKALADLLLKTSHQRYKSTYEDESQMVEGYGGKGFSTRVKALPEPVTGEQGGTKILSQQAIEQAAKDHNISVDEVRKQAAAQGYTVH